jgi:CrcB protein
MLKHILLVGLGGGAGSILRYLASFLILKIFNEPLPLATLAVNVLGCLAAGMCVHFFDATAQPALRLLFIAGFCGGFTTFSAFALENIYLWQAAAYFKVALYTTLSIVSGFAAVWLGMWLTK